MPEFIHSCRFSLQPEDQSRLFNLCGELNHHMHRLEKAFDVDIHIRGHKISISGEDAEALEKARQTITDLYGKTEKDLLNEQAIELAIMQTERMEWARTDGEQTDPQPAINGATDASVNADRSSDKFLEIGKKTSIQLRTENQRAYVRSIAVNQVTLGIGPAGTGKTYLAVASAIKALIERRVQRIVLVRPAVEAGEKLGFLPGDLQQKVDPYLRPMFDALHEFIGEEDVGRKLKQGKIEIASLAYMRGRTLSHSFVVMDEAQNATHNQMLMLLTRMGIGSTMAINGDISQIDLPGRQSGLIEAIKILRGVRELSIHFFDEKDVCRSRLVREIVKAYQCHNQKSGC